MTRSMVRDRRKLWLLASGQMAISFSLAMATPCQAQARKAAAPSFEVASVRHVSAEHGYTSISPSGATQFTAKNVSLMVLIELAFGVDGNQISANPGWLDSDLYDVAAKPEGDAGKSYEQLRPLLQQLLKERFQLATHREVKEVPGYGLVLAKGGAKLKAGKEASAMGYIFTDSLRSPSMSMRVLAGMLASPLGQPVIDKTGLQGNYDVDLKFAPDGSTDSTLPSIFTAVQEQLGLKLERQKVPINLLVIDHVEKVPSEN